MRRGWARAKDGVYICRPRHRPFENVLGFPIEHTTAPLTPFLVERQRILHNFDFLPDRISLTDGPVESGPHASFARGYLHDPAFDYRSADYYKCTVEGTLAVPSRGTPHAEWRCRNFIYLINSMRTQGYQPARYGAICMVHRRDGSVMVINGIHRLAVLLALKIREFPVVFCPENEVRAMFADAVGRLWPSRFYQKNREALNEIGRPLTDKGHEVERLLSKITASSLEMWGDLYHPVPFYEFRNLRTMTNGKTPYRRLAMILSRYGDLRGREVLDVGCNVGFYAFSLAKRGARVTGVDQGSQYIEIAKELSKIYGVPAEFHHLPVTPEWLLTKRGAYDLTLCFSVLQWVIDQRDREYGGQVLEAISAKSNALFFDVAVNAGKAHLSCKAGEEIAFVYSLLRQFTSYPNIEYVGDVEPFGGPRYVFHCWR